MANLVPEGEAFYGIQLPIQTLTRTLADPWEDDATPDDLVRVAKAAAESALAADKDDTDAEGALSRADVRLTVAGAEG